MRALPKDIHSQAEHADPPAQAHGGKAFQMLHLWTVLLTELQSQQTPHSLALSKTLLVPVWQVHRTDDLAKRIVAVPVRSQLKRNYILTR